MSQASHAFKLLNRLYGLILFRMRMREQVIAGGGARRWVGLEPLEPRILFSATPLLEELRTITEGLDTPAVMVDHHGADAGTGEDQAQLNGSAEETRFTPRRELVIIDASTPDYQQLVDDLLQSDDEGREIEVVVLDADQNGVEQISAVLAGHRDLDAVHVISHGRGGGVQLGSEWLSADTLGAQASQIAGWSSALTAEADLLFYGCNLAATESGQALVDTLALLTGADVAASTDLTGQAECGGDWDLEYASGAIEASVALRPEAQAAWSGTLEADPSSQYVALPLAFEDNLGQTDEAVDFLARGSGYTVFLSDGDAVIALNSGDGGYALRLDLVGANEDATVTAGDPVSGTSNYLLGSDPDGHQTGVSHVGSVRYENVYDGIDVRYYGNQRQLEYDFIVAAGADPGVIEIDFQGAQSVHVDESGDLVVRLWEGEEDIHFEAPYAYQDTDAGRVEVSSQYVINAEGQVGFELGSYDTTRELIIDPILDYSTYLGGTGADQAYEITVDATGAIYLLGKTESADFPVGVGSLSGSSDAFVAKLQPDGNGASDLVFATYIGGSGNEYGSGGIELDGAGNIIILGSTESSNFATTAGAYDTSLNGTSDAFVVKLNPNGDTLLYGTYFGGSASESGNGLALDGAGNAYITGQTLSNNLSLVNAYDNSFTGSSDAYVAKLSLAGGGASDLVYATYLGGSSDYEAGTAIAVDASGIIHVAAKGLSADHPTTAGAYQTALSGSSDAVLALFDPSKVGTAQLVYSTFLGGSGSESINAIHLDASGVVYLVGNTSSADFPATAGAFQTTYGGGWDMYLAKLNPLGGGASDLVYATYLGGTGYETANDVYVDGDGTVYVVGAGDVGAPVVNPVQGAYGGGTRDAYVAMLDLVGGGSSDLLFGSYLGGADTDYAYGVVVDASGNVYVAGYTESDDLPTTSGAYSESNAGGAGTADAFVVGITQMVDRGTAIWAESGSTTPEFADLTGSSFGVEGSTANVGQYRVMRGAEAPTRDEKIVVGVDGLGNITGSMWDGSSWSALPINQLGAVDQSYWWSVDVAYESQSGDAVVVWADGNDLKSARWDGSSWSMPTAFHTFATTLPRQLNLAADPTSNEMVLTMGGSDESAAAWVWNGTSFGNFQSLANAGGIGDPTTLNVAYEQQSGHALAAYGKNGDSKLYYRTWDGVSWSGESSVAAPTGETLDPRWIQIASDPTTDGIVVGVITNGNGTNAHAWVNEWDGSSWGTAETVATTLESNVNHPKLAVAFESESGQAMVAYGDGTSTVKYRLSSDGSGWSAELAGPAVGAAPNSMTLDADPASNAIMLSVQDANSDLAFVKWDGSVWDAPSVLETNTGEVKNQPFVFLWDHNPVANVFIVTNTNDSGAGSLRQAILDANSTSNLVEPDVIRFNIGTGAQTINLTSALPVINEAVVIDGTTQPGYAGTPLIQLDGSSAGAGASGLEVSAGGSTIKGLVISNFDGSGISIHTAGGNTIQGNYIGTDAAGTADAGNGDYGINVNNSAGNLIGGPDPGDGNVISGNDLSGVMLYGAGTTGNTVQGNLIGTNAAGTAAVANTHDGIRLVNGASSNAIGGTTAGERNVISGNADDGIELNDAGTDDNEILGNYIGVDVTGTAALGNTRHGVVIYHGVAGTQVGQVGAGNVISANGDTGVVIDGNGDATTAGNVLEANRIGTNAAGTADLGNAVRGIEIFGAASSNIIGGSVAGAGNVVSGNDVAGIQIRGSGTDDNVIQGNIVGLAADGAAVIANGGNGVDINQGAIGTIVGGTTAGERNVISGNGNDGITIWSGSTTGTIVQGNYVGTDVTGTLDRGNASRGVIVSGGSDGNLIGGSTAGAGNVISGNGTDGVRIADVGTTGNTVAGNLIGLDAAGTAVITNDASGVYVSSAASTTIGGLAAGSGNVIAAAYGETAIDVFGASATGTVIQGNLLGTDVTGTTELTGGSFGVWIYESPNVTIGGTAAGAGNVIAGYAVTGVNVSGATGSAVIQGNVIGTDATGTSDFGGVYAVTFQNGASNSTVGGTSAGAGNILAFNSTAGVYFFGNAGNGNAINQNVMYSNGLGIDLESDGVSANDPNDADVGDNALQNYPDLVSAVTDEAGTITIDGTLDSTPGTTFRIEFFASVTGNGSGHGEAETYLGYADVTTDGSGDATFSEAISATVQAGRFITATATDPSGNTSEFSLNVVATSPNEAPVVNDQGFNVDENASNGTSVGTVAASDANSGDTLTYAITGGTGQTAFTINSSTGEITVADSAQLDRETTTSFTLTVEVTDDGVGTLSDTATITITVDDVNDNAPVVTPSQSFNITEAASNGDSVGTVVATDGDTTGSLTGWTITAGNGDGIFQINSSTGEITIANNTNLDREVAGSYVLGIQVGDGVNTSTTETVAITVTDANDTAPVITASQSFNISEAAGNGVSVGTVAATDADTTGSLTGWTIVSGNGDGVFQINSSTGEITIADDTNLDREVTGSYVLGIQVGDGVNTSGTETVAITVTDANDTAPVITASQSFNISEAAGNGVSVGTVAATDADTTGSLTGWTIVSGNGDGVFQINSSTGEITIADDTNLDREVTGSYVLGIQVGDGVNTSGTETVAITVTDANDTAPVITASQSFNISEAAANGVSVGTVAATDADTTGSLTGWTIVSGNGDGVFQINSSTGEITIADNTNLDREVTGSYVLGIQVGDGVNTSTTETVAITVTDANDTAPVITASQSFNVSEAAGNGASVGTVTASDADTTGSLTGWTIVSGNGDGIFQINSSTGEITIADDTNLDREVTGSYVLGIQVGDGVNTSGTETVAITVTDANDTAPVITASQSFNVSEAAGNGASVGTVAATDADTTGSLTGWTIVSGNGDGVFQINSSTGEITIADDTNLDREVTGSYVLGIQVGDGVNTSGTETVAITVTDANDTAPVITASQSFNVSEAAGNGASVGTVTASDADTTGSLTGWTIVSGNGDGIFQINSSTGEITIADDTNLDREVTGSYVLGIQVGDGVNTSGTETVAITVIDANDTAPVITASQSFNVSEAAGNGASVGTVAATDADTTGSLTGWTIVSGNGDGVFQINSSTGEITIADDTNLDREVTGSYVLGVQVGDGVNTSATETVAITVTDANDTAPVITASQSFNVSEAAGNGASVGTVAATDADTTGSLTGWTIVSGNGDGVFQINSSTGEITIADDTNLDRETTGSYVLGIQVGDGENTSATETVAITVTDANDTAPVITASQSFNISEAAANGVSVGTVAATDADTTGSLTGWTIVSGNGDGVFQINSSTGEITIADNTNLDREVTGSYVLGIQVGDGVNTSGTETVAITVTDANDTAPVITASQSFNVSEAAGNGASVGTVTASDADTTGSLTGWTIVSGNGDGIFQINSSTGEITIADDTNIDREVTGSYVLGVQVGDGVNTSATETVVITVTDANDTAPVITASQSFNVSEAAGNGASVGTVAATDADTTGSLTGWTIVSGNGDGVFQIDSSTGAITIADNTNLDREVTGSYVLGVQVGDGVNTSATETVAITVTDANDTAPVITSSQSFNVSEAAGNGASVGTVAATDADTTGALTNWTIVSGNGDGVFQINSSTGEITIADDTNLDREVTGSYILGIQVGDGVNTSTTETVAITVTDANDTAPVITSSQSFSISEAAGKGASVGTVAATDADTTGSLTGWTIVSGNGDGVFQINASTGEITIADNSNLDHETTPAYVLGIQVSDGVNSSAVESVLVAVTNVNEAPTVSPIGDITVDEDAAPIVIDLFSIFEDAEDLDANLQLSVVGNTNAGLLSAITIDGDAGTLTLATTPDQSGAADLTVRATDSGDQSVQTTFTITINAVNDAPDLAENSGLAVDQGRDVTVTSADLEVSDVDNTASQILFTMTAGPANGTLALDGVTLTEGDTFTQEDIDSGRLAYRHDGSMHGEDSFQFTVQDGAGGIIDATISMITINLNEPVTVPALMDGPDTAATSVSAVQAPKIETTETTDTSRSDETSTTETEPEVDGPQESSRSESAGSVRLGFIPDGKGRMASSRLAEAHMPQELSAAGSFGPVSRTTEPHAESNVWGLPGAAMSIARQTLPVLAQTAIAQLSPDVVVHQIAVAADRIRNEMESSSRTVAISFGSAAAATGALAVGYTVWAVRGGSLLASMLSTLPMWSLLDPLPVLEQARSEQSQRQGSDNRDDDIESRIGRMLQ